jgi:hypothetical protein
MKRYRVMNMDDLRLALRSGEIRSDAVVDVGDEMRVAVLFEGGGHNSLGGSKATVSILEEGVEIETVSIPLTEDRAYNWWQRAVIFPLTKPVKVEIISERWGGLEPSRSLGRALRALPGWNKRTNTAR